MQQCDTFVLLDECWLQWKRRARVNFNCFVHESTICWVFYINYSNEKSNLTIQRNLFYNLHTRKTCLGESKANPVSFIHPKRNETPFNASRKSVNRTFFALRKLLPGQMVNYASSRTLPHPHYARNRNVCCTFDVAATWAHGSKRNRAALFNLLLGCKSAADTKNTHTHTHTLAVMKVK